MNCEWVFEIEFWTFPRQTELIWTLCCIWSQLPWIIQSFYNVLLQTVSMEMGVATVVTQTQPSGASPACLGSMKVFMMR